MEVVCNPMPFMKQVAVMIISTVFACGCAANPEPIIDTKGVDPDLLAEDMAECEAYTEQIDVAQGVGKGAALGGAVGAATGAVSNRRDVDEGAGLGAIYGGTRSGLEADREKQRVWKNCMRGRGYRVLN